MLILDPLAGPSALRDWQPLSTTSLTSGSASVCFQHITPDYRAFRLWIDAPVTPLALRFNEDRGARYSWRYMTPSGLLATGSRRERESEFVLSLPAASPGEPAPLLVLVAKPGVGSLAQVAARRALADQPATPTPAGELTGEWKGDGLIHRIDITAPDGLPAGTTVRLEGTSAMAG